MKQITILIFLTLSLSAFSNTNKCKSDQLKTVAGINECMKYTAAAGFNTNYSPYGYLTSNVVDDSQNLNQVFSKFSLKYALSDSCYYSVNKEVYKQYKSGELNVQKVGVIINQEDVTFVEVYFFNKTENSTQMIQLMRVGEDDECARDVVADILGYDYSDDVVYEDFFKALGLNNENEVFYCGGMYDDSPEYGCNVIVPEVLNRK